MLLNFTISSFFALPAILGKVLAILKNLAAVAALQHRNLAMKFPNLEFDYDDAGRIELLQFVDAIVKRYTDEEDCTGVLTPPRSGKAAVVFLSALELRNVGAPFVHAVTPWKNLADQLTSSEKIEKTLQFYGARGYKGEITTDSLSSISHHKYWQYGQGDAPTLLASTIHLIHSNICIVEQAIRYAYESTGMRPCYIIDETHLVGQERKWYDTASRLLEAGAYVVAMTGTEVRSDKKLAFGFTYEPVINVEPKQQRSSVFKGKTTSEDGIQKYEIGIGSSITTEYKILPVGTEPVYISTAFERGWCAPLEMKLFDFSFKEKGGNRTSNVGDAKLIELQGITIQLLQSDECIIASVRFFLNELARLRQNPETKDAKGMFITLSDEKHLIAKGDKLKDERANYHARLIKKELKQQLSILDPESRSVFGRMNIEICTSTDLNGEPDQNAANKLHLFTRTSIDKETGDDPIDVLLVKNMGVVGLDVPELKVMVDLSNLSCCSPKIQANLRTTTVWSDKQVTAINILPKLPENQKFAEQCGSWGNNVKISEFTEEESRLVAIKDKPLPEIEVVQGSAYVAAYYDSHGKMTIGDHEQAIKIVRRKYPVTHIMTVSQILETIEIGGFPLCDNDYKDPGPTPKEQVVVGNGVTIIDIGAKRQKLKQDRPFGKTAQDLTSKLVSYSTDKTLWVKVYKRLVSNAKTYSGVSKGESVESITDPDLLLSLVDNLDRSYEEMKVEFS